MSDKDKIQAAIDALEALEGLPIAHDVDRALFDLRFELNHPYSDSYYTCKGCREKHKERSSLRGGYCASCWRESLK